MGGVPFPRQRVHTYNSHNSQTHTHTHTPLELCDAHYVLLSRLRASQSSVCGPECDGRTEHRHRHTPDITPHHTASRARTHPFTALRSTIHKCSRAQVCQRNPWTLPMPRQLCLHRHELSTLPALLSDDVRVFLLLRCQRLLLQLLPSHRHLLFLFSVASGVSQQASVCM
jgi:hypothetical protein